MDDMWRPTTTSDPVGLLTDSEPTDASKTPDVDWAQRQPPPVQASAAQQQPQPVQASGAQQQPQPVEAEVLAASSKAKAIAMAKPMETQPQAPPAKANPAFHVHLGDDGPAPPPSRPAPSPPGAHNKDDSLANVARAESPRRNATCRGQEAPRVCTPSWSRCAITSTCNSSSWFSWWPWSEPASQIPFSGGATEQCWWPGHARTTERARRATCCASVSQGEGEAAQGEGEDAKGEEEG